MIDLNYLYDTIYTTQYIVVGWLYIQLHVGEVSTATITKEKQLKYTKEKK